ncbi:hypothetical protein BJ166DRAFT_10496 [Pestalotiopsis sp. NC0098]|nr:hypothetical protein BJ166DRAFT_10496 [Pestalotiopsis sp. NC0098]
MFPQRYSCDRCRQQKSRCPKTWDIPALVSGGANYLTPCERCTKADVPCVYSLKKTSRRPRGEDVSPTKGNTGLSQDHLSVLSSSEVTGYNLDDMMMPSLDTTVACTDDGDVYSGDAYSWTQPSSGISALGTNLLLSHDEGKEENPTEQLMKMSNWATGATRELEREATPTPLTVNSLVVSEAFEAANTLVRIINDILLAGSADGSPQASPLPTEYSPIFLALASHQHILALFRAVCDSIKRSLSFTCEAIQPEEQTLHAAGSSSAQSVMILQLIMHLLNRISRSLRIRNQKNTETHDLMFGIESGAEDRSSQSIIDSAQVMLRTLPDEHARLREVIQELQDHIEEGVNV